MTYKYFNIYFFKYNLFLFKKYKLYKLGIQKNLVINIINLKYPRKINLYKKYIFEFIFNIFP
jgi:hypothetical protein